MDDRIKAHVIQQSSARKVVGLPVVNTSYDTCPDECELNPRTGPGGCYAEMGYGGGIARITEMYLDEVEVDDVVQIIKLNPAKLIRDRQVGDVDVDDDLDFYGSEHISFMNEVGARTRKQVYGYTRNWKDSRHDYSRDLSNYTLNASCYTINEVENALERGFDATLIADDIKDGQRVPGYPEYRFINCLEETQDIPCHACGICARKDRDQVVVFTPHGSKQNTVRATLRELTNREHNREDYSR